MKNIIGVVLILFASMVQSADFQKNSALTIPSFEEWKQEKHAEELKRRAEQGDSNAQFNMGSLYLYKIKNKNKNNKQAVYWFRKAAEQGDKDAQETLARMYFYGLGALQNYKQAAHWFRKAGEQGNNEAQKQLGSMYVNGQGVIVKSGV